MTISFNSIPVNIRTPGQFIEYDNTRAVQRVADMPNVALIVAQKLAAGTVAEAVPIMVESPAAGETYFGHGSYLAGMIEAFKTVDPWTELWAIALDDEGAGVAATGTFPFAGAATEAGNIYLYIGGERIVVAVASGDANTVVSAAVDAAITAYLLDNNLPVSSSEAAGTVTITALHKGTNGNKIDLQLNYNAGEALPAGITCTPVQMSSGATDPAVSDAIAVFSDKWYTTVVSGLSDDTNQDLMEAELLARWGPMRMQNGHCFIGVEGNQGTLTTAGNARNSQFTTLMGAGVSPTPEWIWAAVAAAADTNEPDPARPRQTLLLQGVLPPLPADQFTQTERNTLLSDGVSTYTISQDGRCYVERLITTYQTNPLSVPDPSYLDITTMRTLAYLRYSLRARIALRFPRHKLADDGTNFGPGQPIATPSTIRSEIFALFAQWEAAGLVEGWEQFKKDIIVERDASDVNRVNCLLSPDLLNQFRVFAGQMQFLL